MQVLERARFWQEELAQGRNAVLTHVHSINPSESSG